MVVDWQQHVSKGRLSGWHCGCVELVVGEVWFEKKSCAERKRVCMGSGRKTKQKRELAAIDAAEETVQESRLRATSDQSQKSG